MSSTEDVPAATAPSQWAVAGVQRAAGPDGRARVEVIVRGKASGSVDRGEGVDLLRIAVWDDGQEMDHKIVRVPLGSSTVVEARLGFDGHVATTADGIGITVTAGADPGGERVFDLDPFVPRQG
ncbi:MAG: hypothetical protein DWB45_07385 [Xanthomonadales bacterium]|nr:MAG: hypothetical protein F9K31_13385 [Dokdonella sp.]MBC6942528.1 hypothetical protein [Xanthomonadales bacterium]MCW5579363.1 hypothetical protein [Dokdonella sp.]MDL1867820.1 hypothetical protein [Gammaproteobacteria bacterium PRO6]